MADNFGAGRKTDRGWEFTDTLTLQSIESLEGNPIIKDDYPGAFKPQIQGTPHPSGLGLMPVGPTGNQEGQLPQGKGLVVKMAATHSGLITRNNGFYLPEKMRAATSTWTDIYPKPIQVHHEDHNDPVGRTMSAVYVDTTNQAAEKFKNHVLRDAKKQDMGRADQYFFSKLSDKKTSFAQSLNMVQLMDSVLEDPHYRGTGYIELTADITDEAAVIKVLNGIYLTGSVGAVSNKAVCSLCLTNWIEEDHCGHRPGKMYDGKRCFVITGDIEYDEYSFVNTPADRHSGILSIQNSLNSTIKNSFLKRGLYMPIADNFQREEPEMAESNNSTETVEPKTPDNTSVEGKVEDDKKVATPEVAVENTKTDTIEAVITLLLANSDAEITDVQSDLIYEEMMKEIESNEAFKDAKLSPEQRKKLPKSTFCGPNKSLPVNDEAHYIAAKKLVDKYKGEVTKSKILSAIERKGKALGCVTTEAPVKDSVVQTPAVAPVTDNKLSVGIVQSLLHALDTGLYGSPWDSSTADTKLPVLDDSEVAQLKSLITALVKRLGKDNFERALVEENLAVTKDEFETQLNESIKLETSLASKQDQLTALRQELQAIYTDLVAMQDQLVDLNSKLRSQKISRLENLSELAGTLNDEFKSNLLTLSDDVLDNSLETLSKKVDITKIADKVNNGTSRIPQETVENPLLDNVQAKNETKVVTYASQTAVDNEYYRIMIKEKNPGKAKAFYDLAVKDGKASPRT